MHLQKMRNQPRKPEPCDNCSGLALDQPAVIADILTLPKLVTRYNIFPHGPFVLCAPCAVEMAR